MPLSKLSENHKINVIGPTELKFWPFKDALFNAGRNTQHDVMTHVTGYGSTCKGSWLSSSSDRDTMNAVE